METFVAGLMCVDDIFILVFVKTRINRADANVSTSDRLSAEG